jgi:hypothetical protein
MKKIYRFYVSKVCEFNPDTEEEGEPLSPSFVVSSLCPAMFREMQGEDSIKVVRANSLGPFIELEF